MFDTTAALNNVFMDVLDKIDWLEGDALYNLDLRVTLEEHWHEIGIEWRERDRFLAASDKLFA